MANLQYGNYDSLWIVAIDTHVYPLKSEHLVSPWDLAFIELVKDSSIINTDSGLFLFFKCSLAVVHKWNNAWSA